MKLTGDLETIGPAELFKTLIERKAHGVLSIHSPMGEKQIILAPNEVVVRSDQAAERMRLGDLLVVRGFLSEARLESILKDQNQDAGKSGRYRLLGDLLVQNGCVTRQNINDAVRFQLEEEFFDLFTWRKASFEFDDTEEAWNSAVTEPASGQSKFIVQRFSIEPHRLIREALRRTEEWTKIERRLPTQYLCFKLTEKGEEAWNDAPPQLKRIMRLIREGRTIETCVKRSCAGRFAVCRAIIKMLDEGRLFPYPASELRALAEEHRMADRYADALYIYRRLLEICDGSEKAELVALIDSTVAAVRAAQAAGGHPEGVDLIRHRAAAEVFRRRRRLKYLVSGGVGAVLFTVVGVQLASLAVRDPAPRYPPAFLKTRRKAALLESGAKYEAAAACWRKLLAAQNSPDAPLALEIQNRLERTRHNFESYVEARLEEAERLEEDGQEEKARRAYASLLNDYSSFPRPDQTRRVRKGLERITGQRARRLDEARLKRFHRKLLQARKNEAAGKYSEARQLFIAASEGAYAGSEVRREAEAGLARLKEREDKMLSEVRRAEALLGSRQGEKALKVFQAAAALWPTLSAAREAAEKSARLRLRLDLARQALNEAEKAAAKTNPAEVVRRLKAVAEDYPEFELSRGIPDLLKEYEKKQGRLKRMTAELRAAWKAGRREETRALFARLSDRERDLLAAAGVRLPVRILSRPSGALVRLDGVERGKTPLKLELPLSFSGELQVSRRGFKPLLRRFNGLRPEDLRVSFQLERAADRIVETDVPLLAPPVVLGGKLYLADGLRLRCFSLSGDKEFWSSPPLLDDKEKSRPASDGTGRNVFVGDPRWWRLRTPPTADLSGAPLLVARNRKVFRFSPAGKPTTVVRLPVEPLGPAYEDRVALLDGKRLLLVLCADGVLRAYDLSVPLRGRTGAPLLWKRRVGPLPRSGVFSGALLPPTSAGFPRTLLRNGVLCARLPHNGAVKWTLKPGSLSNNLDYSLTPDGRLCALLAADGRVFLTDAVAGKLLWTIEPSRPGRRATAIALGSDRLCVVGGDGGIRLFPLKSTAGRAPKPLWKVTVIGARVPTPPRRGVPLFIASAAAVYALDPDSGAVRWRFRAASSPVKLVVIGRYLYVTLKKKGAAVLEIAPPERGDRPSSKSKPNDGDGKPAAASIHE